MKFGINFTGDSWAWRGMARGYGADSPGGRNEGAGGKADKDKSDGGGNGRGGHANDRDGVPGKDKNGNKRSKESLAAAGSQKVSEMQNRNTPIGKALESSEAEDSTRYGVGAMASAGSPAQREAMNQQANDINEGDGVGGLLGGIGLRERFDLSNVAGTQAPDTRASWGFDVAQALANFAGLATGYPVGTLYTGARMMGMPPVAEVNLGPDVFSSNPTTGEDGWGNSFDGAGPAGSPPDRRGADGKGNGLLVGQAQVPPQQTPPASTPTSPTPGTPVTPIAQAPSKFPTPMQRFQGASYWAGDWVYDPATQKVEWKQKASNGLLPEGAAA